MSLPRIIRPTERVLLDQIISDVQEVLATELTFLDHVFGKVQVATQNKLKRKQTYPAAFYQTESRDRYLDLTPSKEYGNYCFFVVDDDQEVETVNRLLYRIKTDCSIIFWFDLSTLGASTDRRLEYIKNLILDTLTTSLYTPSGKFSVSRVHERAANIFKEFSILETDSQYLMQPYAGLRFDGELIWENRNNC